MADSNPYQLPPSLDLPTHLSAQKYFFVCTLTVAAWDTLVLTPRTWRLLRTREWPLLKIFYHVMRVYMPIEFTAVGVAFFDTSFSLARCQSFYLVEPILTAVLLAVCSLVHVIRIHAIYEKNRAVLGGMSTLLLLQVVVTAVCCGFYQVTPLQVGQGCIAEPKHKWVGVYWLSATLLYTASFALALNRSFQSLNIKPISYWKLMLRDGLNLYGAIWLVNMVNMPFWFIITPTGPEDPIRTIVTSMTAVLTTTMTLRIILSVRGSLASGGTFAVSSSSRPTRSGGTTHVISTNRNVAGVTSNPVLTIHQVPATYTVPLAEGKEQDWVGDTDGHSSLVEGKEGIFSSPTAPIDKADIGVTITVDTETDFTRQYRQ
ncbi:hypothetical protein SCP_0700770 [Sparassis crispa]|uniref:Transmembrane protein n=1 Tax=Sparassis crispa TaxID=139825 RepID=A0A401GRP7_9APHY|nr:hypothetical protein SCP_0700770 [Sparassis crispa]GBE84897.1 hypothetical protein SCP_0700770 [Sparassis crispa]